MNTIEIESIKMNLHFHLNYSTQPPRLSPTQSYFDKEEIRFVIWHTSAEYGIKNDLPLTAQGEPFTSSSVWSDRTLFVKAGSLVDINCSTYHFEQTGAGSWKIKGCVLPNGEALPLAKAKDMWLQECIKATEYWVKLSKIERKRYKKENKLK